MPINVIILAAGAGSRFKSAVPKVLHKLAGKPLLQHVVDTAKKLLPAQIVVVYGNNSESVKATFQDEKIVWVLQPRPQGTGDAVKYALSAITNPGPVLILYGDVPLIGEATLATLLNAVQNNAVALVTVTMPASNHYGRIVRNTKGDIDRIVEVKDATPEQLTIQEINAGIYCVSQLFLKKWLPALSPHNASREYYLTDIIEMAVKDGVTINAVHPVTAIEITGVNTRAELAQLERHYQRQKAQQLLDNGVTLLDPSRIEVRGECDIAYDVVIDVNVILEGDVTIQQGTTIGANVILRNVHIGKNVVIKPFSHLDGAVIADNCSVGPFARLRAGTELAEEVHIGNFVEIKNSCIAGRSKVNHLSYVGDADVGQEVNIGAGTITCNYDGVNKHKTVIEDNAFIGSNTALVAPVIVGKNATIAAGSTISQNAPSEQLTIARAKQRSIAGWKKPGKKKEN